MNTHEPTSDLRETRMCMDCQAEPALSHQYMCKSCKTIYDLRTALEGLCELAERHIPHLNQMPDYLTARAAITEATQP